MKSSDRKYFDALSETDLLGLNIEREAGGEPREGRIAVGTITLERVEHRDWDGKTIREVILWPWQFSWTMPEAGAAYYRQSVNMARNWKQTYLDSMSLRGCIDLAAGLIDGTIPRDPDLAAAHCCEYVAGTYRKHMDANPEIKCNRWWQKMQLLKVIAGHEFYISKGTRS